MRRDSASKEEEKALRQQIEKDDVEFEKKCQGIVTNENWEELYEVAKSRLEETMGKSFKGFFYMGISFYKTDDFDNAIRAF